MSRFGARTYDDRFSQFENSKDKNLNYLLDKNRRLKEKLNNLKRVKFCENCKRIFADDDPEIDDQDEAVASRKNAKRSLSANVRQPIDETDNSFMTEFPIEKTNQLKMVNKNLSVAKNLFEEFNKFESSGTHKGKDDRLYQEKKHNLSVSIENTYDKDFKRSGFNQKADMLVCDDDFKLSNRCSNDTKKHELPDAHTMQKKHFTFTHSLGMGSPQSSKNDALHSINSEESKEYKQEVKGLSEFNNLKDGKGFVKRSQFIHIVNEIMQSDISVEDIYSRNKPSTGKKKTICPDSAEPVDLDTIVADNTDSITQKSGSHPGQHISTPQFSVNKENPGHIQEYMKQQSTKHLNEHISGKKKFKEDELAVDDEEIFCSGIKSGKKLNFGKKSYIELKLDTAEKLVHEYTLRKETQKRLEDVESAISKDNVDLKSRKQESINLDRISNPNPEVKNFFNDLSTVQKQTSEAIFEVPSNVIEFVEKEGFETYPESPDFNNKIECNIEVKINGQGADEIICSLDNENMHRMFLTAENADRKPRDPNYSSSANHNVLCPSNRTEWFVDKHKIISFSNIDHQVEVPVPVIVGSIEETMPKEIIEPKKEISLQMDMIREQELLETAYNKHGALNSFIDSKIHYMLLSNACNSDSKQKQPIKSCGAGNMPNHLNAPETSIKEVPDSESENSQKEDKRRRGYAIVQEKDSGLQFTEGNRPVNIAITCEGQLPKHQSIQKLSEHKIRAFSQSREQPCLQTSLKNTQTDELDEDSIAISNMLKKYKYNDEEFISKLVEPVFTEPPNINNCDITQFKDDQPQFFDNIHVQMGERKPDEKDTRTHRQTNYENQCQFEQAGDETRQQNNIEESIKVERMPSEVSSYDYDAKKPPLVVHSLQNIGNDKIATALKMKSYQNFHICTQSKKNLDENTPERCQQPKVDNTIHFSVKNLEPVAPVDTRQQIRDFLHEKVSQNGNISPILKKRKDSCFSRRSQFDMHYDSRMININNSDLHGQQDQTLVDVVDKINMDASQLNKIQDSLSMIRPRRTLDQDVSYTDTQENNNEARRSHFRDSEGDHSPHQFSGTKFSKVLYAKRTNEDKVIHYDQPKLKGFDHKLAPKTFDNMTRQSYSKSKFEMAKPEGHVLFQTKIAMDEPGYNERNSDNDYEYYEEVDKDDKSVIEIDLDDSVNANETKHVTPSNKWLAKISVKQSLTPVVKKSVASKIVTKHLKDRELTPVMKPKDYVAVGKKYAKNSDLCPKLNKKASLQPKESKKYTKLYQKQKMQSTKPLTTNYNERYVELDLSDSDVRLLGAHGYTSYAPVEERGPYYPYVTDKKIITIKKSEVVFGKKFSQEIWNKENKQDSRKFYQNGAPARDYSDQIDTELIKLKNEHLLMQIEEIEKSFEN